MEWSLVRSFYHVTLQDGKEYCLDTENVCDLEKTFGLDVLLNAASKVVGVDVDSVYHVRNLVSPKLQRGIENVEDIFGSVGPGVPEYDVQTKDR